MAMPSLGATLKLFDKVVLKDFLNMMSSTAFADFDWSSKEAMSNLEKSITALNGKDRKLYSTIYSRLNDICIVAEKNSDYKFYIGIVHKTPELNKPFLEQFKLTRPTIATFAMWLSTVSPKIFEDMLRRKIANSKNAGGGTRYCLPSNFDGRVAGDSEPLANAIRDYFGHKHHVVHQVNVDRNNLGDFVRFVIAINPMPKEEPAFAEDATEPYPEDGVGKSLSSAHTGNDTLGKAMVKTPDIIFISYYEKTPRKAASVFTVKAESITKEDCDQVANIFAEKMLSSHVAEKCEIRHDLEGFKKRPQDFDFAKAEEDWRGTYYRGIYMTISEASVGKDARKVQPEVYHRMFPGDLYDEMARRKELENISDGLKTVVKLFLDVKIVSGIKPSSMQANFIYGDEDNREEKTYRIIVPAKGEWTVSPKPSLVDEAKLVRILEAMELFNRRGEQILNVRKTKKTR